ncbi:LysR family transcriptional regulator [Vibrio sp. RC27]
MDNRALKYFEVVCNTGSVRSASEVLHVSPSAISRKVAQLESKLGVKLMERVGRGIKITEPGLRLAEYIRDVNLRQNILITELSELDNLKTGTLQISIGGGFIPDFVDTALSKFSSRHPGIKTILHVGGGDDIIERITHDVTDIGILLNAKPDPRVEVLYSCRFQELSLLVPNSSPWAKLKRCSSQQLTDIPLAILNNTFDIRRAIDLFEVRQGIRLKLAMECNSFEALKQYVEAGLGGTLLPQVCVTKELRNHHFTTVPVDGMHSLDTTVDLIIRKGKAQSASVKEMKACIIDNMGAFNIKDNCTCGTKS